MMNVNNQIQILQILASRYAWAISVILQGSLS